MLSPHRCRLSNDRQFRWMDCMDYIYTIYERLNSIYQDAMIYYDPAYATNNNFALCTWFQNVRLICGFTILILDLTKHFWTFKHFSNFIKRE